MEMQLTNIFRRNFFDSCYMVKLLTAVFAYVNHRFAFLNNINKI